MELHIILAQIAASMTGVVAVVDLFAEDSCEALWEELFDDWCGVAAGVLALLMAIVAVLHRLLG